MTRSVEHVGWLFERRDDGSVRMRRYKIAAAPGTDRMPDRGHPVVDVVFSGEAWAQIVLGLAPHLPDDET